MSSSLYYCPFCGKEILENKIENGYGYIAIVLKCPKCKKIEVLYYEEDGSLDVNNDRQFYEY